MLNYRYLVDESASHTIWGTKSGLGWQENHTSVSSEPKWREMAVKIRQEQSSVAHLRVPSFGGRVKGWIRGNRSEDTSVSRTVPLCCPALDTGRDTYGWKQIKGTGNNYIRKRSRQFIKVYTHATVGPELQTK